MIATYRDSGRRDSLFTSCLLYARPRYGREPIVELDVTLRVVDSLNDFVAGPLSLTGHWSTWRTVIFSRYLIVLSAEVVSVRFLGRAGVALRSSCWLHGVA